jgi:hypothetical protein
MFHLYLDIFPLLGKVCILIVSINFLKPSLAFMDEIPLVGGGGDAGACYSAEPNLPDLNLPAAAEPNLPDLNLPAVEATSTETPLTTQEPSGAAPSTTPEWERALALPQEHKVPPALILKIREEIRILLNIGKERVISDDALDGFMEPLALSKKNVDFASHLLSRVETLQTEFGNGGECVRFDIRRHRERVYSTLKEKSFNVGKWE